MDFQKSKALLDKINALYRNINADPRNISSIERDLMRSYIQQFYESFLEMPTVASAITPTPPPAVEPRPAETKITLRKPETAPIPPPTPRPQLEPLPPPLVVVEKAPIEAPAPVAAPPPPVVVVEKPPVEVLPPVVAPAPPPVKVEVYVPPTFHPMGTPDPELEELFSFKTATELSEKLSQLPIGDIKKAMGLNERISTQNELFGGDAAAFDATIATLNQLKSYEEAKDYLLRNVAVKYGWAGKGKKDKSKEFIKLIRRRY